MRQLAN